MARPTRACLLKHLETLDIDIACMQEAVEYDGRTGGIVTSYQKIGNSLRFDQHFFSPLSAIKLGSKELSFGNVTYANTPFLENTHYFYAR